MASTFGTVRTVSTRLDRLGGSCTRLASPVLGTVRRPGTAKHGLERRRDDRRRSPILDHGPLLGALTSAASSRPLPQGRAAAFCCGRHAARARSERARRHRARLGLRLEVDRHGFRSGRGRLGRGPRRRKLQRDVVPALARALRDLGAARQLEPRRDGLGAGREARVVARRPGGIAAPGSARSGRPRAARRPRRTP